MKISKNIITKIDDKEIFLLEFINNNNFVLSFFNFGCYINSIKIPYYNNNKYFEDVVLGYKDFQGYFNDSSYMNCVIGRVCGRISRSRFNLDSQKYILNSNDGSNHLHGGQKGFNKKVWQIVDINESSNSLKCIMKYVSPNLEEGYPGELTTQITYILNNNNEFIIEFNASTDQNTIINLTNHNYWNFHGHHSYYQNIENHYVKINGNMYCETDNNLIPTGNLLQVKDTKLDFFNYKIIDSNILDNNGIDNCYSINTRNKLFNSQNLDKKDTQKVASIYSNFTKMGMDLYSTNPGLQLYTGNMMNESYNGKYNKKYGYQYGLCLEPQYFPDSINCKNFNSPILKKEKKYFQKIIMKLRNDFD